MLKHLFEQIENESLPQTAWSYARRGLQEWLADISRLGPPATQEPAERCLDLLIEIAQRGDLQKINQFDQVFPVLRRQLSWEDCRDLISTACPIGFLELAANPEPADLAFYHRLALEWRDQAAEAPGSAVLASDWLGYLTEVQHGRKILASEAVRAFHCQHIKTVAYLEGRASAQGPTEWSALNSVLNSGPHLEAALHWFVDETRKRVLSPRTNNVRIMEAARELSSLQQQLESRISIYLQSGMDTNEFLAELAILGMSFLAAQRRLQELLDQPAQTRCLRCGTDNPASRNLCGSCGARLIRDFSQEEVVSLVESHRESSEAELPRHLANLYDALERAESGDTLALGAAIAEFRQHYFQWERAIRRNPFISDNPEISDGPIKELVGLAQAIVADLNESVQSMLGWLEQFTQTNSSQCLEEARQDLDQIVQLVEHMRLFQEELSHLSSSS
jgi:hypothetical protein